MVSARSEYGRGLGRSTLQAELARAIERGQLELHYQPKACVRTGAIIGAEALVRWQHPCRGVLLPDDFIPTADESGLIVPLGEWAIDTVCRHIGSGGLAMDGKPLVISVDMSPVQLHLSRPVNAVRTALGRYAVRPGLLEIELTQSSSELDFRALSEQLIEIAKLGVRLALDDFGVGFSNLSHLGRLPLDVLKIDRALVTGVATGTRDRVIVRAVTEMAHALGMDVLAEGVRTTAQLSILQAIGCDAVQGHLIARPMELTEFASWLNSWKSSAVGRLCRILGRTAEAGVSCARE